MGRWIHRLSNIRPTEKLADCADCGPGVPAKFRKTGSRWTCKTVERQREAKRREHDTVSRREWYWRAIDGMEPFDVARYNELLFDQGGVCAICDGVNASGKFLAVDHDHETGAVRGLLCSRCNSGLGLMKDDPERLLRAIQYIQAASA